MVDFIAMSSDNGLAGSMTEWLQDKGIPPILIVFIISLLPIFSLAFSPFSFR